MVINLILLDAFDRMFDWLDQVLMFVMYGLFIFIALIVAFVAWGAYESRKEEKESEAKQALEQEKQARLRAIERELQGKTNLPVQTGAIKEEDVQYINRFLQAIKKCKDSQYYFRSVVASGSVPTDEQKARYRDSLFQAADENISLFYRIVLRSQCEKLQIDYSPYSDKLKGAMDAAGTLSLRTGKGEQDVLNNIPAQELVDIEKLSRANLCEGIHDYLEELEAISKESIDSFLFVSLDKAESKTKRMQSILRKVESQVSEVKEWCLNINELLNVARVEAYKNQYLGFEILNLISSESDEYDKSVELSQIDLEGLDVSNLSFGIKEFESSINGVTSALLGVTGSLSLLRTSKAASAAGLAVLAITASKNLEKKIEIIGQHGKLQGAILKYVTDIIPQLESVIVQRKQALDVIVSIVQANRGFLSVYSPLRNSIFIEKKSPRQIPDILEQSCQLKSAINLYVQISSKKV